MTKSRVPLHGNPQKFVTVETDATVGAVVGVNLRWPDGTLVQESDFAPEASGQSRVIWRYILEIPPNVTALAETASTGLYVITGPGTSETRELLNGLGISITDGDGVAGDPTIAHGDTSSVTDITANFSGSTVVGQISLTFDQFGHVLTRTITGRQLDHNQVNAIQGGAPGEYYHLTSAEHTKVQALPAASQPLDDDLTAIAALATTGFPVRTAANTWALRSFANGTGYTWTNPAGVAGNPTLVLDATLQSLAGQNWVLNSIPVGSGADTVTQLALGANTFPARSSAGNVAAKPITDFGLSLIDDGNAAAARTTLEAMADTQPFMVATISAAQALVAGVNTKVNLDTDVVDPNGWFDTGTGRFTPQQAGLYSVISTIAFSRPGASTTTGQRLIAYIFKNGAQEVAVTAANLSQSNTIEQAVGLVQMNGTTDYIEMYARSDATDAYQVGAGAANTTLRAVRVSA